MKVDTKAWRAYLEDAQRHRVSVDADEMMSLISVYEAACAWRDAEHVMDANHAAGDCDACAKPAAAEHLECVIDETRRLK